MPPETPPASSRLHPAVWVVTALTAAVHLAVAGRYDIFRNELYFIVCGWHPDFGYADQPPLVPLIAAATQMLGINAWLLRLPAVIAATALVPLAALFARRLGGSTASAVIAAIAASIAPALIGLTAILTTTTFEPIAWTACAYCIALAALTDNRKAMIWAGGIVGLSLEAKYGIAPWLAGLVIGLLATPVRRLFAWRETWLGAGIAIALAAPSLIWQAAHGWPFAALIAHHNASHAIFTGSPLHYEIVQVFALNVVLAPLWIAGIIAPFAIERLKPVRFLAIAFVIATVITIAAGGKDYYMFAAYPAMFAVGAAAFRAIRAWLASLWLALALAQSVILAPVVLPLLDPPRLARLFAHSHLRPPPDESAAVGAPLTQVFSDELGWRALEHQVAAVWRALPANERAHAAILATNYGEAAAIDVYGKADGLPPALSGQNQYYLWGPRGFDGSVIIHVNGDPERWRDGCASVETVATFGAPYVMPYENNAPIFLCRGLKRPLAEIWPRLQRYQ